MIINKSTQDIIRVLLNEKDKLTMRELASKASVSLGMTVKIINALESSGYTEKKRGIKVKNWEKLVKAWGHTVSIRELKKIEFSAAERPQFVIKKIASILNKNKIKYAFTLFSATEVLAPYVAPAETHLYILKEDRKKIEKLFKKENILPAEKGNVVCFLGDESYFYNSQNIRGIKIISSPQLYVDLFSYGGRGEDAAENLLEVIEDV